MTIPELTLILGFWAILGAVGPRTRPAGAALLIAFVLGPIWWLITMISPALRSEGSKPRIVYPPPDLSSIAVRLAQLEDLKQRRLLHEVRYRAKREQLMKEL
jgi:hypothetical protein